MVRIPEVFWVALFVGFAQAIERLDLSQASWPVLAAVFVVGAVAKALQEGGSMTRSIKRRPYWWRVVFG